MIKCIILFPIRYNDGEVIPRAVSRQAFVKLNLAFRGYTKAGDVKGVYVMDNGEICRETTRQIWVAVEPGDGVSRLRAIVQGFVKLFKQECMYLEVAGHVELVR